MNWLLKLLRDALLLAVLLTVMLFAVSRVVLPYRRVFAQAGAYQLEAFETGLAFYHYGLNGPQVFYRLSPLNDFVTTKQASRSAHLSQVNLEQENYTAKWQEATKSLAILETLKQFTGQAMPWYEVDSEGVKVRYETLRDGQEWLLTKTVTFAKPTYVGQTSMTLNYFRNDLVFDGVTTEAYRPINEEQAKQILTWYGLSAETENQELWSSVASSGVVHVINPDKPGYLTVIAGDKQQVILNRSYSLLEVVEQVDREVTELTQTIRIRAHDGRQQ